jgi:hypothetical protein
MIVTLTAESPAKWLETVTDAEGRYQFTALEPGDYSVAAASADHRSTHVRRAFGQTSTSSGALSVKRRIGIKPGELRSGIDIALPRAFAIEGRVSDPWDEAMAEVSVRVTRADGVPAGAADVYSDDRGMFRVFGLAPGRYHVCAYPQSAQTSPADPSIFRRTCHLSSMAEEQASDVVIAAEDVAGIDIRVQRSASYSISGSVIDADGTPVDAAFVGALSLDDPDVTANAATQRGEFVLRGVTPGRYIVNAGVDGGRYPGDPEPALRERELGYALVQVSSDMSGVVVVLSRAIKLNGRVIFEGSRPSRTTQKNMVVFAAPPFDNVGRRLTIRPNFVGVTTDLKFELTGLYRLPLVIRFQNPPDGWVLESVRYNGRDITNLPVDFGADSTRGALEIVLTNTVADASIRVVDAHGDPVTDYRAVLWPDNRRNGRAVWRQYSKPSRPRVSRGLGRDSRQVPYRGSHSR